LPLPAWDLLPNFQKDILIVHLKQSGFQQLQLLHPEDVHINAPSVTGQFLAPGSGSIALNIPKMIRHLIAKYGIKI